MSNRELPYTQNSSPLFENVLFANFGDQPGRHAQTADTRPDEATELPVYRDAFDALRERYPDVAVTYASMREAREDGADDLLLHQVRRSTQSDLSIAEGGGRFPGGDEELTPVTFLPGVQDPRGHTPPDDAS